MTFTFRTRLLGLFLAASPVLCLAKTKISTDAMQSAGQQTVPIIIQYNVPPSAKHTDRIANLGGHTSRIFASVPAIAANVPGAALSVLAADPSVKYITVDRPVGSRAAWYSAEPINAPILWKSGLDGSGIGIAVIDSGIDPGLSDLGGHKTRVVFAHNFLTDSNGNLIPNTQDLYGHGTHVAGIIAGNGNHSTGNQYFRTFKGIAPNANLIDLQVLDQNGEGTDSNVIAAIDMAIALKKTYNIRVINLSLGRPVFESYAQDPLCQAVEQAWEAGIVVVVAAGNDGRLQTFNPDGYGTINSPANDPYVLTVGATDTNGTATIQDDTVASYSSKGPSLFDDFAKPDLMAPGSQIASLRISDGLLEEDNPQLVTLHSEYIVNSDSNPSADYFPLSGTSMAAAVTSGASALLLEVQPKLTPDQVKALLMRDAAKGVFPSSSTVTDATGSYTSYNDLLTVGAGYLNIEASVIDALLNSSTLPTGYALSPMTNLDPTTGEISLVFNQSSLWTYDNTWAPAAIYGSQNIVDVVDGLTIIWGRSSLTGSTIIWGRSDAAIAQSSTDAVASAPTLLY